MSMQIKFLVLLFPGLFLLQSLDAQYVSDSILSVKIDSLHNLISTEYTNSLRSYQIENSKILKEQRLRIDELETNVGQLETALEDLEQKDKELERKLEIAKRDIAENKLIISQERANLKRILYIAGPSILLLILVSVLLYFLLMLKHQEQTDMKINALRKYTHSELEETRNVLLKKFRKRIKKVSEGLTGNGKSKGKKSSKTSKSSTK